MLLYYGTGACNVPWQKQTLCPPKTDLFSFQHPEDFPQLCNVSGKGHVCVQDNHLNWAEIKNQYNTSGSDLKR